MDADDMDADRFRVGPWVPDPVAEPGAGSPADRAASAGQSIRDGLPPADEQAFPEPAGTLTPVDQERDGERPRGHRRVASPFFRHRLALAAVLAAGGVVVSLVVALAVALAVVRPHQHSGRPPTAGGVGSTAGAPVGGIAQSPSPTPSQGPSQRGPAGPGSPQPTPAPGATLLTPITYQAEAAANTLGGSARVADYPGASGGKIVRNIGLWSRGGRWSRWSRGSRGSGWSGAGTLRFDGVMAPADGRYTLTFFYVHINNEPTRTAVITVSGADPISATVAGGSTCCASKVITVVLRKGANAISFGNPNGHAPSIDKIVIGAEPIA